LRCVVFGFKARAQEPVGVTGFPSLKYGTGATP
jgi:hypothetical protein